MQDDKMFTDFSNILKSFSHIELTTPQMHLFKDYSLGPIEHDKKGGGKIYIEAADTWRLILMLPKIVNVNTYVQLTKKQDVVFVYYENLSPQVTAITDDIKYPNE
ncbi:hypothetical protein RFI_29292 [Reticulomyxa filosa]|uniref:Uncharacterized protein n=1 Tax=Reticulomyxa filosa TaxID=46433 RepID=X6M2H9_RETFI|nr:hypothetical protein RFI_29292 [Reticulomyxa filosa]|eukprot:ETO08094.1 hypothetical protein RFI_29292 [Reticulomyxa filosa]